MQKKWLYTKEKKNKLQTYTMQRIYVILLVLFITVVVILLIWALNLPNHAGITYSASKCTTDCEHLTFKQQVRVPAPANTEMFNPTLLERGPFDLICVARTRTFVPGLACFKGTSSMVFVSTLGFNHQTGHLTLRSQAKAPLQESAHFEDPRLISGTTFLCAKLSKDGVKNIFQPAVLVLSPDLGSVQSHKLIGNIPPSYGQTNKNWTAFRHDTDKLLVHTHSYPKFILHELDSATWELGAKILDLDMRNFFAGLRFRGKHPHHVRGTTNWVRTPQNTYLTILHFCAPREPLVPHKPIRSIFLELRCQDFQPIGWAGPVCFGHKCRNIQFATALLLRGQDDVWLGYGLDDKETWLAQTTLSAIRALYRVTSQGDVLPGSALTAEHNTHKSSHAGAKACGEREVRRTRAK